MHNKLRVSPNQAQLPLDASATFSASLYGKKGAPLNTGKVSWRAHNVGEDSAAWITPQGIFTARLPGFYRITAKAGKYRGYATIRVPEGITHNPKLQPSQTTTVSSIGSPGTPPPLPQPPISSVGWQDINFQRAFFLQNRLGPFRPHTQTLKPSMLRPSSIHVSNNPGNGNYLLSIPLLQLPGRGLDLSLTLYYNSKLWLKMQDPAVANQWDMVYDHDHGWPAPGWSLGFGKVIRMGSYGVALEDADGTLHPFAGKVNTYPDTTSEFPSNTVDGTLIQCHFWLSSGGVLNHGQAWYPDGTTVQYGAADDNAIYPTRITDRNGNYITITYTHNNIGPALDRVVDTIGRAVDFSYDPDGLLTAVSAPDVGGGARTLIRLHHRWRLLTYAFASGLNPIAPQQPMSLDAIYLPGTSTGYWFGDSGSYSGYGMIAKVSQRRAMEFSGSSLNQQGAIVNQGLVTQEQTYNYPLAPNAALADAPTFTELTETWAGMDVPPAVTTYSTKMDADPGSIETVSPDGTRAIQLIHNDPNKYDYGLVYEQTTYDSSNKILRSVATTFDLGDYESPRIAQVQVTDRLNQTTTTKYAYDPKAGTNQLTDVTELGYRLSAFRTRHTDYVHCPSYWKVLNLPSAVTVLDSQHNAVFLTGYDYDYGRYKYDNGRGQCNTSPLPEPAETPGVVSHDDAYDPNAPALVIAGHKETTCDVTDRKGKNVVLCATVYVSQTEVSAYIPATDYRGNVTKVTTYANASDPNSGIPENRQYDITGNMVASATASCCEQVVARYGPETEYAYRSSVIRGAQADPTASVAQSFVYDFNTGLDLSKTDANGLTTSLSYEPTTLRVRRVVLPTSASSTYVYDDMNMSTTQTQADSTGRLAGQSVTYRNGRGLVERTQSQANSGGWDAVSQQYDALGRLSKKSQPYELPQQPTLWTSLSYDALGRVTSVQAPDGSRTLTCYDESKRPSSASQEPGRTERVISNIPSSASTSCQSAPGTDPGVRERWSRTDAFAQLAEVVEPDAYGNGSVFDPNSVNTPTSYSHNALNLLTDVVQGTDKQERTFRYDSLSRLTAEYLPEKSRTLDDSGTYLGDKGHWSDVFAYDDRSNLVSHTDARGVVTTYDYGKNPLNRLQRVSYGPASDPTSPVVPVPPVTYKYMTTGDVRRPFQVSTQRGADNSWGLQEFGYDVQGRLRSKKVTLSALMGGGGYTALLDYDAYDDFGRLTDMTYPAEYGTAAAARKSAHYAYGTGGNLTDLQFGNLDYASQLTYNPAGQATLVAVGPAGAQQTTDTFGYDPATGLIHTEHVQRGSSPLLDMTYKYYPSGQLNEIDESDKSFDYDYDALGRLWHAAGKGTEGSQWSETYGFDPYGNRTSVAASGQANGSPIPPDGLPSLSYSVQTNRVTTPGFAYDAAGNQTRAQRADGSWLKYVYDAADRLSIVTDDNNRVVENYAYGVDGRRTAKLDGRTQTSYLWDGNHSIAEYVQSEGNVAWAKSTLYLGDAVLATFIPATSGELTYYHHPDRLGTRLITNSTDNTATEQLTLPFGTLMPSKSSDPVNPIFTSYDRSTATGLDYAINRHYDSEERFTQVDPAGMRAVSLTKPQSLNLYSYSGNDPINGADPSGLDDSDTGSGSEFPGSAFKEIALVALDVILENAGIEAPPLGAVVAGAEIAVWVAPYLQQDEPGAGTPGPGEFPTVPSAQDPGAPSGGTILDYTETVTPTATGGEQTTVAFTDGTTITGSVDANGNMTFEMDLSSASVAASGGFDRLGGVGEKKD